MLLSHSTHSSDTGIRLLSNDLMLRRGPLNENKLTDEESDEGVDLHQFGGRVIPPAEPWPSSYIACSGYVGLMEEMPRCIPNSSFSTLAGTLELIQEFPQLIHTLHFSLLIVAVDPIRGPWHELARENMEAPRESGGEPHSPSEGPERRHLGRKKKPRESARVPTLTSATSTACGCCACLTWPITRLVTTTENSQSSNTTSVVPPFSGRIQSTITRKSTASTGIGSTATSMMAMAVAHRTGDTTVKGAEKGAWGPWEVACSASRGEGIHGRR
ncbi:hypothetical protein HETIRDRAFT_115389 [Heterobasidion irregulare TC 32-1]|uniref:Uncharacterized protein n=1 Tax=Heterobasidion irregulare (strain TC 32-1) TaxID=747525 RepID=W4KHA8_HETIT|nr:uncharacterized protein HETIRDRAFT_115389 [Heterobasidion irregulare TC 32-1]ETW85222.1 hypothetical protein HETIRDRAFT_115389 [Heterobasidion irregulare TC 32-1]